MIIWLIGISGAGKTTIGRKLESYYKSLGKRTYLLDGDEVRSLFNNDLGYSEKERQENIKRIILGAYLLDKNDVIGIVCNISPFESLRELARNKIAGYNEFYLKKNLDISMKNDVKGVYKNNTGKTAIIGVDIKFEEPKNSDLILEVDKQTVEETYLCVRSFINTKYNIG